MELHFVKMNPSGNTTILVTDSVPREQYTAVANRLMQPGCVGAEQVGFIRKTGNGFRMEMMGGEFCGNASRCFAAWKLFLQPGDPPAVLPGVPEHTRVDVSGAEAPLDAAVRIVGEKTYEVFLDIPLPRELRELESAAFGNIAAVVFDGIVHIILPDRRPEAGDEQKALALLKEEGLSDEAFGLMYLDRSGSILRPYVVVRDTGSRVWESSCGSGSCAAALWLASRSGAEEQTFHLRQPGGELIVTVSKDHGKPAGLTLGGPVRVEAAGTAEV